jgi:hypothetical protein
MTASIESIFGSYAPKTSVITLTNGGPEITIRELSVIHLHAVLAEQDIGLRTCLAVKYGVPELADMEPSDISEKISAKPLGDIALKVFELSGLGLEDEDKKK